MRNFRCGWKNSLSGTRWSGWTTAYPTAPTPWHLFTWDDSVSFLTLRIARLNFSLSPAPPPWATALLQSYTYTRIRIIISWWRGSVVRTSVCSWRTFPDLRLIHGWRVTTLWVRRPLWVQPTIDRLSRLPSVGRGMSSIAVARWMKLLAAVSPSSECFPPPKWPILCRVGR